MYDHTMLSWHAKIARHTTIDHKYPWHRKRSTQKQQKQKIPRRHKIWSSVEREIARKQKHHTCCGWNGHGATVAVITNIIISFKYFCTSRRFNVSMAVLLAGRMQSTSAAAIAEKVKTTFTVYIHSGQHSLPISSVFSPACIHIRELPPVCTVWVCVVCVCVHVPSVKCFSYFYNTTWCSAPYFLLWKVIFWSVSIQTASMDAHSKIAEI